MFYYLIGIRKICYNNLKWKNHCNNLIAIIFIIYCIVAITWKKLFYNLFQWQTWSCNEAIIAKIKNQLFYNLLYQQIWNI